MGGNGFTEPDLRHEEKKTGKRDESANKHWIVRSVEAS